MKRQDFSFMHMLNWSRGKMLENPKELGSKVL